MKSKSHHATAAVPGDAGPEPLPPKRMKTRLISVRMDDPTIERLEGVAKTKGLAVSSLIRMWALQCLAQELPDSGDPWV